MPDSIPTSDADLAWIVAAVRIPAQPSRHRVAVWRELRRIGAAPVGQGVWTVPDVPVCIRGMERVAELAAEGGGDVMMLVARGRSAGDEAKLAALFSNAREEDWAEFIADCQKFIAEIAREIAKDKLTLAELDEEEQSLERLRRWHRDVKKRDVLGSSSAVEALALLRRCNDDLEAYADLVYARVSQS